MEIAKLTIKNFRGVKESELFFNGHTVIVGDNNVGKSTILEAIDLTLGPDRLSKIPVVDEHDFYAGEYVDCNNWPIPITIETIIIGLNDEQERRFLTNIEFWDKQTKSLLKGAPLSDTDKETVVPCLRILFTGMYDKDEDDFIGKTYFSSPEIEDGTLQSFSKYDKRVCGFIYMRTLRTGTRALSLEHGSLLDIILKLMELRPQMWEDILVQLRQVVVAENPDLGISGILNNIQTAIREIVPIEWAETPKLQVSNLTREHLRKILTVFIGTGISKSDDTSSSIPFYHQGTGTINALVLVLLSMIADLKQNVIFAMEEPEIAIPPYTQKRIIESIVQKSSQAIFTSHSPYVLEEFNPMQILVLNRDSNGFLVGKSEKFPVKPKLYKEELRRKFCEGLLARRVLITEGRTEYDAFPACIKKLNEFEPNKYKSFDALGIAIINAETDSQVAPIGRYYKDIGKKVFAVFDKQSSDSLLQIQSSVDHSYEANEKGFENVIINGISQAILKEYALDLVKNNEWPTHYTDKPNNMSSENDIKEMMKRFLIDRKGSGEAAELLFRCKKKDDMPKYIVDTINDIISHINT